MTEAFPLHWPEGWARTKDYRRKWSLAGGRGQSWGKVLRRLRLEVERIGGTHLVVSTNQPLRRDGLPYANTRRIDDPGAAIYFMRDDRQLVMAQDAYDLLIDNLRSLALAIEGLRQMERHGGAVMLERAFSGFEALPAPGTKPWWQILQVPRDASKTDCTRAYRRLAFERHPDHGGSDALMAELTEAHRQALERADGS